MRKVTMYGITATVHQEGPLSDNFELLMKAISDAGGVTEYFELDRDRGAPSRLLKDQWAELMEKYPDRWIVMGDDGLVCVADSHEEALVEVDRRGISRNHVRIEFMDTNPPILIPTAWRLE